MFQILRRRLELLSYSKGLFLKICWRDFLYIFYKIFHLFGRSIEKLNKSLMEGLSAIHTKYRVDDTTIIDCRLVDYFHSIDEIFRGKVYDFFPVKKGDIVFDVGAGIGEYTFKILRECEKIIAVEANPEIFSILKKNLENNHIHHVSAFHFAAYSSVGEIQIYKGEITHGDSVLRGEKGSGEVYMMKTTTLDEIAKELNLPKVDLLKIDVEGAELEVLKGSLQILTHRPRLMIETHSVEIEKAVDSFLQERQYKVAFEIEEEKNLKLKFYQP